MNTPDKSSAAERMRRYRYRQRHNLVSFSGDMPLNLAEALLDAGYLPEDDADDRKALGDALTKLGLDWLNNKVGRGDY